jgi:MarR family transcriptional regulator, organic hydroperoxide resistance regulator
LNDSVRLLETRFRALNRIYRQRMRQILESHGLYFGQTNILSTLMDAGSLTQKEISQKLSISQATVAVSIRRLLKGGFLLRSSDKADLRRNRIELTEKGKLAALECREQTDELFLRMCRDLSKQEILSLASAFERLSDNIQAMES